MDWIVAVGFVGPICCLVGAVTARLFMSTTRRDQTDIVLARAESGLGEPTMGVADNAPPPPPPLADDADDAEYSEGFDASEILRASNKASALQRSTAKRVEQRRTTNTLRSIGANPDLVKSIVAASRAHNRR